jgi:small GTP-binding protein
MKSITPRVVVIGTAAVGKTALINRIIHSRFEAITAPTTGTAFFEYKSEHPVHPEIQLWDTAGMERYRSVNSVFYREAIGAILTFDLTSIQSFTELESWLDEFTTHAQPNSTVVLCGNKCDLADQVEVEPDEIRTFCDTHQLQFFQTSACTGEGVPELMNGLLNAIPAAQAPTSTEILVPQEVKGKCC